MLEIIKKSLTKHQDGIMKFTLGETTIDEDNEIKICYVYSAEWSQHSENIAISIKNILMSDMPLEANMIVGIIVNEWFNYVGCDVKDLDYYGLLGVAISIIKDITE